MTWARVIVFDFVTLPGYLRTNMQKEYLQEEFEEKKICTYL